jgi:hypothetical protein
VNVSEDEVFIDACARTATIHISPVLGNGKEIDGITWSNHSSTAAAQPLANALRVNIQSFESLDDDSDLADYFQGNTAANIPYGDYELHIESNLGRTTVRPVGVYEPEVWVTVGINFVTSEHDYVGPSEVLTGTVNHISPDEDPVYVRLLGIYLDYAIDDRVKISGTSGTFTLAGNNPYGKFLLVTTGRTGALDIREVDIPAKNPVVIDLSQPGGLPAAVP